MSEKPKTAPLTDPDAFFLRMAALESLNWEDRHARGDKLMMNLLRELGYGKAVDLFDDWYKWYA